MGNFTKKPIKLTHTQYTYHEHFRTSDKLSIFGVLFTVSLLVYLFHFGTPVNANKEGICNSKKCEERIDRIISCERYSKNKDKVIECASWKTTFARKQVTRFERVEIEQEIKELYDKIHNKLEVYNKNWDRNDEKQKTLQKLLEEGKKQGIEGEKLKDMLGTFLGENGNLNPKLKSYIVGSNGYRDIGICQINIGFHPEITNHPDFNNIDFQVKKCVELYKGGTKFYGARNKEKMKRNLVFNF